MFIKMTFDFLYNIPMPTGQYVDLFSLYTTTMATDHACTNGFAYGHVLISNQLDNLARSDPEHVFASLPQSATFADGLYDITFRTLAQAVNRIAWWLDSTLGKSTNFETIAYIGPGWIMPC